MIEQAARTIYEGFFATQPLRYVPWNEAEEGIKDNNRLRACALADAGLLSTPTPPAGERDANLEAALKLQDQNATLEAEIERLRAELDRLTAQKDSWWDHVAAERAKLQRRIDAALEVCDEYAGDRITNAAAVESEIRAALSGPAPTTEGRQGEDETLRLLTDIEQEAERAQLARDTRCAECDQHELIDKLRGQVQALAKTARRYKRQRDGVAFEGDEIPAAPQSDDTEGEGR